MVTTNFTYGSNHNMGCNAYTSIIGVDAETARQVQVALHKDKWAFQYDDDAKWQDMIAKYDLVCVESVEIERDDENHPEP